MLPLEVKVEKPKLGERINKFKEELKTKKTNIKNKIKKPKLK